MRVAVNTWIFGQASIDDVIRRAGAIGFDGLELVGEPKEYLGKGIGSRAAAAGLSIVSICGMFPGPEPDDLRALCHPDAREREKAIGYVKRCVDLAVEVSARRVLVVPGLVGQPRPFVSREHDLALAAESLSGAAEYARQHQVLLMIEPINRYEVGLVNTVGEAIALAERVGDPAVRAMGDTFHMQIEEPDGIPNAIRRAGRHWLQHLHIADNTRVAPGMGAMDWLEIVRALVQIGFEGVLSLEPLPKGAQPYEARAGKIPPEVLDRSLAFGLKHLRHEMQRVELQQG